MRMSEVSSLLIEIYKNEVVVNSTIFLAIDENIFQHLSDISGDKSRCKVVELTKDETVLMCHGYLIHRFSYDNIIPTIHLLMEELAHEDYEIVDKRSREDLVC